MNLLTDLTFYCIILVKEIHILELEGIEMSQAVFSIQTDENLKKQFDLLCSNLGMSASTAINIFIQKVVKEQKIPFDVDSDKTEITREKALQAFYDLRKQAQKNGLQDMTLDEINEEIRLARLERENRK